MAINLSRYWFSPARLARRQYPGVGLEIQDKMAAVARTRSTVDYGWLWFIQPLFKLLKWIHSFVGNWGFHITTITFIVRGIMYPLTKCSTPPWRRRVCSAEDSGNA
ncbi:hypothetical protein ACNKHN_21100 [Shigella flexneri]